MTPLPTDPLNLTIVLFENMHDWQVAGGQVSGKVNDDFDFDRLREALDNAELLISSIPATRTIECYIAEGFYMSMQELLSSTARRITAPQKFYLADSKSLYCGDPAALPPLGQNYIAITRLYAMLAKEADHQGGIGDAKTLVFLHKEKIEITPTYSVDDIHVLENLHEFESQFIESETHKEQKRTIVKTVLLEMFFGQRKLDFSKLLARFSEFLEKAQASYQLYVAEFSFQKVKAEVEKEKLDAMIKLNKVFSDVQSQLLTVPVALVLVGGQMENKAEWTSKNVLVWLGAIVFAILMDLLIRNQRHTLKAVKNEIDEQKKQMNSKYHAIADRFSKIYQEIEDRHTHQRRLIFIVDFLVALSLGVTTGLLLWYSGAIDLNSLGNFLQTMARFI